MKEIINFLKGILTGPDDTSYSSKRVGGFISLFATIIYGFVAKTPVADVLFTFGGLTIAFFGLTSYDYKSIINNKIATGDTDPAKV